MTCLHFGLLRRVARPGVFFLAALLPASAQADACGDIVASITALASAPAYRQTISLKGQSDVQVVVIGERFHINADGKWTSAELPPGGRQKLTQEIVGAPGALKDCTALGSESLDGAAMKVFTYSTPVVAGVGGGGKQKLWIRASDGLPRRMVVNDGVLELNLSFDDVKAPTP